MAKETLQSFKLGDVEITLPEVKDHPVSVGAVEKSVKIDGSYEGTANEAKAPGSTALGGGVVAKSDGSHAEGVLTTAGRVAESEIGSKAANEAITKAVSTINSNGGDISGSGPELAIRLGGFGAHAEGMNSQALGSAAHAEGSNNEAIANSAHAEGDATKAYGQASHSEGYQTHAFGNQSHAEGADTYARSYEAHAEGKGTEANGKHSHAEGFYTEANGEDSHAEGKYTIANGEAQHVQGIYNYPLGDDYLHIVGNGTSDNARSNAYALDRNGNASFTGNVTAYGNMEACCFGGTEVAVDNVVAYEGTFKDFIIVNGFQFDSAFQFEITYDDGDVKYLSVLGAEFNG